MAGRVTSFIEELNRRKVIQTAGVYLVGAFVTMQVVDAVFQYLPFRDPEAAGTFVLAVLAVGFPIALSLSWFLEITPPQFHRELPRPEAAPLPETTGTQPPKALREDSVAVLPLDNLSDDTENQYFSDGITEDIIASVARIRGLRVLSRSSVMQYRGVNRAVGEIAVELGVGTVVTGSVRRSGSRIRIFAEVVDAVSNDRLWSDTYDRQLEDIFEVQSDVAASIATAVQRELTLADRRSIATRGTTDAEAYDLYLRARHLWNQRTESAVGESLGFFERAIERDPGFALAHASLAEAYDVLGIYGARAPATVFPAARKSATTALSLDPSLGEALAAAACVTAVYDWDWGAAEADFKRALLLAPSYPTAHQWYAVNVLAPQGRFADARIELDHASELDPASSAIAVSRGVVAFYSRDYASATQAFAKTLALHPHFGLVHFFLGQCQILLGDTEKGLETLANALHLSDESSESIAAYGHALGATRPEEASALLRRLEDRASRRYVSPALIAQILVGLGRLDEAIERLVEAADSKATDLIWLGVRPHYDPLREMPAFKDLIQRVNLQSTP